MTSLAVALEPQFGNIFVSLVQEKTFLNVSDSLLPRRSKMAAGNRIWKYSMKIRNGAPLDLKIQVKPERSERMVGVMEFGR